MPTLDDFGLLIRVMAAVVWSMLTIRALQLHRAHGHYLRRIVMVGSMTAVLWGLVLRGAAIVGLIEGGWTTVAITATVFAAFMAGASLLTTQPDP